MILAGLADIVQVPFGWLLDFLYQLTTNYGVSLIIFAFLVKIILLPATAKAKKSSMKMSRLTPQVQAIQKKYANDQQKQGQEMQALYKREGVSMGGSCLWSFLPILILIPLYTVVRQPIVYMLGQTLEQAELIVEVVKEKLPDLFTTGNSFYSQMLAAAHIPEFVEDIKAALPEVSEKTLAGINFNFLGINLGEVPTFNIFGDKWSWDWAHIGAFLVPVLSAASQMLTMLVTTKTNNSLITDEKGLEDKETAKQSQAGQQSKMMMYMMPLFSLWIGFTVPAALSLYWLAQGIVSTISDLYLNQKYRKIYDAEDAERLKKALAEEAEEAEKERQRAQRRAENPDGITTNTSKKKMQQKKQQEQEEAKAAAAKEYAAKKGIITETEEEEGSEKPLSGIADRPNCKGRAYDPNRYNTHNTEE